MKSTRVRLAVGLLVLAGCGGDGEDDPSDHSHDGGLPPPMVDCSAMPVPTYTELSAVFAKCTTCHASSRTGTMRLEAPVGVDFDTHAAAQANAEQAAAQVYAGAMPPEFFPELTDAEKAQLYQWSLCGTPQ